MYSITMSDPQTGSPATIPAQNQTTPDTGTQIKESWINGFIQGNTKWPEEARGIGIFTTLAIVKDPPKSWPELLNSQFTLEQLSKIGGIASAFHRVHGVNLTTEEAATEGEQTMGNDRLSLLWKEIIQNTVVNTISNSIDSFGSHDQIMQRSAENKTMAIQIFFDNPENKEHIAELIHILEVAQTVLTRDDSIGLSDFYKDALMNNESYRKSLEQYRIKYRETFHDSVYFEEHPGKGAWRLAANNIKNAFATELPSQDVSWLELDTA
jgi:hypothetical protein